MNKRRPASSGYTLTSPLRLIIQTFIGTRLAMAIIAIWLGWRHHRSFSDLIANWDVQHFLEIARNGYQNQLDTAFFPGWPAVLRVFNQLGIMMERGGLVMSLFFSALSAAALWRLGGKKIGPWAAILWLLAPTAIFTVVPYTESLFCALAFWAWERAKTRQWWAMALLAGLACTVRVSGLFLIGALAVLIVTRTQENGNKTSKATTWKPLLWLLLPVAVLFAYVDYQYLRTGDWMAWYHAQTSGWSRALPTDQPLWLTLLLAPWQSFQHTVPVILPGAYADHPGWSWIFRGEVISMLVGTISTIVLLLRRRWAEASWIGIQIYAFSLSYWWMSVNRAVLLWFPLWLLLGEFCAWKPRSESGQSVHRIVIAIGITSSFIVSMIWAGFFYLGMWAS